MCTEIVEIPFFQSLTLNDGMHDNIALVRRSRFLKWKEGMMIVPVHHS